MVTNSHSNRVLFVAFNKRLVRADIQRKRDEICAKILPARRGVDASFRGRGRRAETAVRTSQGHARVWVPAAAARGGPWASVSVVAVELERGEYRGVGVFLVFGIHIGARVSAVA